MCGIGALLDPAATAPVDAGARMTARRPAAGSGHARPYPPRDIDVAGGDQPLDSEDGAITAIVNGEIYNHAEVRTELEAAGHRFATRSDSEVVVHGYEEHGTDVVRHLNGIFAFALWDSRAKRLVAARDPFGVKPLYWCSDGRRVALASEVGALMAAGLVEPRMDPARLLEPAYAALQLAQEAPTTTKPPWSRLSACHQRLVRGGQRAQIEASHALPSG